MGDALDLINALNLERAALPDRFSGVFGNDAKIGLGITGVGFNFKPDAKFIFRFPDFDHIGAGIAGNHGLLFTYKNVGLCLRGEGPILLMSSGFNRDDMVTLKFPSVLYPIGLKGML